MVMPASVSVTIMFQCRRCSVRSGLLPAFLPACGWGRGIPQRPEVPIRSRMRTLLSDADRCPGARSESDCVMVVALWDASACWGGWDTHLGAVGRMLHGRHSTAPLHRLRHPRSLCACSPNESSPHHVVKVQPPRFAIVRRWRPPPKKKNRPQWWPRTTAVLANNELRNKALDLD